MRSVIRKACLYLPVLLTTFFAFRVWSAGHIMPAALLTTLSAALAFLAIAVE
ncbi:hypothetical protein J9R20_004787 [Salmonella enterica]|nr:hypothetical protein [Salmonella enterica]